MARVNHKASGFNSVDDHNYLVFEICLKVADIISKVGEKIKHYSTLSTTKSIR